MTTRPWIPAVRRALSGARRVAILGVGNPDRGDDGAGLACIRALRRVRPRLSPSFVRLVDAGPAPENFTGRVRRFAPSHVIVVDAARARRRPGAVFLIPRGLIAHEDISSHRLPLSWLAAYLGETVPCRVLILGIQPGRAVIGPRLSPDVRKAADELAFELSRILEKVRPQKAGRKRTARTRAVRSSSA